MIAEVGSLLRARDGAYRAGNTAALLSTRTALKKGIKAARHQEDVEGNPNTDGVQGKAAGN